MISQIEMALKMKFNPVAIIWSDKLPEDAMRFKEGRWGCVMWLFANVAKGRTAAFDRNTYGCWGGGVGLGFGNTYQYFPGGQSCFEHFLSSGNKDYELGQNVAQSLQNLARKDFLEDFLEGERYVKTPEKVRKFLEQMPMMDVPTKYVVFKPLKDVDPTLEKPKVIVFPVNSHELAALVVLANYGRDSFDNVIFPWGAGCQTIGIFAYKEISSSLQKAVVGLSDISARKNVRNHLGDDIFTFAVPFDMFQEMESNVKESFLTRPTWISLKTPPSP
ncbi:protein of unknown function DUF169 [Thermodesulfobium narugense DSM 14796]|uniref:Uncharacterized protein n=1 Tax=Thermodesulfobium narugense DSM 14796 TaxID=747365 RepID=M1E527_9BACT|nr:DUF169 domain-containing protein [Thermodesulfobium narugense]AEE13966.1 protein of unknown function DUF169 [Thermodesulfobium narugense DSM 14796]